MKIRNATPNDLHIHYPDGSMLVMERDIPAPRCIEHSVAMGEIDGFALHAVTLGAVEGLPPAAEGVFLIVSQLVADAAPERTDLVSPGTPVRDDAGRIVGCAGLRAGAGLRREAGATSDGRPGATRALDAARVVAWLEDVDLLAYYDGDCPIADLADNFRRDFGIDPELRPDAGRVPDNEREGIIAYLRAESQLIGVVADEIERRWGGAPTPQRHRDTPRT